MKIRQPLGTAQLALASAARSWLDSNKSNIARDWFDTETIVSRHDDIEVDNDFKHALMALSVIDLGEEVLLIEPSSTSAYVVMVYLMFGTCLSINSIDGVVSSSPGD